MLLVARCPLNYLPRRSDAHRHLLTAKLFQFVSCIRALPPPLKVCPRPGPALLRAMSSGSAVAQCWSSDDVIVWMGHLQAYPQRIEALGKANLSDLDSSYRGLSEILKGRDPPHITSSELATIVEWKLTRGKWRPRLLDFAREHSDDAVKDASTDAFKSAAAGDSTAAFAALTKLKGIGPATASAVLAVAAPDTCPFMSDEAASAALPGVKLKYNAKEYQQLAAALCDKAEQLNGGKMSGGEGSGSGMDGGKEDDKGTSSGGGSEGGVGGGFSHVWTASDVERSLWSAAASNRKPSKPSTAAGKRKTADQGSKAVKGRQKPSVS